MKTKVLDEKSQESREADLTLKNKGLLKIGKME